MIIKLDWDQVLTKTISFCFVGASMVLFNEARKYGDFQSSAPMSSVALGFLFIGGLFFFLK